jgi:hypothetical protein
MPVTSFPHLLHLRLLQLGPHGYTNLTLSSSLKPCHLAENKVSFSIIYLPVTSFPHFLHLRLLQLGPLVVLLLHEPPFLNLEGPKGRAHDQEFSDRVFEASGSVETLFVDRDVFAAFELVNKLMWIRKIKMSELKREREKK